MSEAPCLSKAEGCLTGRIESKADCFYPFAIDECLKRAKQPARLDPSNFNEKQKPAHITPRRREAT